MRSASALLLLPAAALLACGGSKSSSGTHTLRISVTGSGTVAVSPTGESCSAGTCTSTHASGTQLTLTASAAGGYAFAGWTGACRGAATCSITLGADAAVMATFVLAGANAIPITVNGALCSASTVTSYVNKPCVAVTICTPGTSSCQTVDDVLLDTGSYGLRLFKQVVSVALTTATSGAGTLAECIQFGDGSAFWGPVKIADVVLGGEPAVTVPIQIVDSTFPGLPSSCCGPGAPTPCPDQTPAQASLNGILGVGPFADDCGPGCTVAGNGRYWSCTGASCTSPGVPVASQVQNPVALLIGDSNGVIVDLDPVPATGAASSAGLLLLGIGTQANNAPGGTALLGNPADNGYIQTIFDGSTTSGFLDTGSNALYFAPPAVLANCPSPNSTFYCPASTTALQATNRNYLGNAVPSSVVDFQIASLTGYPAASNVLPGMGGSLPAALNGFDWGLPFFLGRRVYVGIDGASSALGTGPYYSY